MASRFSDAQLIVILQKAARRINRVLCLTGTDSEIVVNTTTGDITPANGDLHDVVLLQSECLISQLELVDELADGAGVSIKDGEQSVDTRGAGVARGTFFNSGNSPCSELKIALRDMKLEGINPGGPGKLVW